jgi:N6-adenosine-specific RNA methylase IME4
MQTGTGYWFRNQHEVLLVGTKGRVVPPAHGQQFPSIIYAPRRAHSEKPDEVYAMIERLWPTTDKLEMFSRRHRKGWRRGWGNEVEDEAAE